MNEITTTESTAQQQISEILCSYYNEMQRSFIKILPCNRRKQLVQDLINAYSAIPLDQRGDLLVPASANYISLRAVDAYNTGIKWEYHILYKWPRRKGFAGGRKNRSKIILDSGVVMDRLGQANNAYFTAPLDEKGKPYSFLSRALPYYMENEFLNNIQDHPAYHVYKVKRAFVRPRKYEKRLPQELRVRGRVYKGLIAPAFQKKPQDGGGYQYYLPAPVKVLCNKGCLVEVDKRDTTKIKDDSSRNADIED